MIKKVYVILTKNNCNANCKFCITNTRDYGDRPQFLKADESFENTLKNLQKIGVQKFELTGGGEPLLNVDYQKIIDTIRKYFKHSYIKFYTNGYKCLPIKNIDELNISAVGLDINQIGHIICSPSYKPLQKILEFYKNENYKKRISLLTVKGAIDSKSKMAEFVEKTQKYVDEYVVRTTYIGTPFYLELHTDFEYTHPKVVWEKDMCACQSNDTAILFTDNILYSDWNLNHKYIENQKFSNLILIKPDFSTYLDKLLEYIKKNNIKIQKIYKLNDFYNQAQIFYKDFKTPKYFEIVKNHLQSSCELFGNTGLLLVIENSKQTPQKLLDLKKYFRDNFSFSKKFNKCILYKLNPNHNLGKFVDVSDNDFNKNDYGLCQINLLHIPDDDEIKTLWLMFEDKHYFDDKTQVSKSTFQRMAKYHSFFVGEL